MANKHLAVALEKLQNALVRLAKNCASESACPGDKVNCIRVVLFVCEAFGNVTKFQTEARDVCEKALQAATDLGFSPMIPMAMFQSGCLAAKSGNNEVAERYIR